MTFWRGFLIGRLMSVRFFRMVCVRVSCSDSNKLHKKEESTAKHDPAKYEAINETNNKILQQIAPLLSDLQNQCNSCWPFLTRHSWCFSDDQSVFFFPPKAIKSQRVVQNHHRQDNRPLSFHLHLKIHNWNFWNKLFRIRRYAELRTLSKAEI